ncbi:amidohydrolase family protein, partial [Singulisphaera rosea]
RAREFLIKYQDRLLFATDFGLREIPPAIGAKGLLARHTVDWDFFSGDAKMDYEGRPTRGLALPEPVLRKLFRDNARRWLPGIGV